MEKFLVYQEFGPLKGWRKLRSKSALGFAAKAMRSSEKWTGSVDKLKVELALGDPDGYNVFSGLHVLLTEFRDALAHTEHLKCLDLGNCEINDKTLEKYICPGLKKNKSITELRLYNNRLTAQGIEHLFDSLPPQLEKLNLSTNINMDPKAAKFFLASGVKFYNLEEFDISHCTGFGAEGFNQLVKALGESAGGGLLKLKKLKLSGLNLGDDGASRIAEFLEILRAKNMATLKSLLIADCGIREFGLKELTDKLTKFPLEELDLNKNHIGDAGLPFLGKLVLDTPTLKKLHLKLCGFSQDPFIDFLDQLEVSYDNGAISRLEVLNISKNGLGDGTVLKLTKLLLHRLSCLHTIMYDGNEMTDKGAKLWGLYFKVQIGAVERELKVRDGRVFRDVVDDRSGNALKGLVKLTLKENKMTWEGLEHITERLQATSRVLVHLDIRKNNVGIEGARLLKKMFLGHARDQLDKKFQEQFTLEVFPEDVGGPAGINEIFVGMRAACDLEISQSRYEFRKWLEDNNEENEKDLLDFLTVETLANGSKISPSKPGVDEKTGICIGAHLAASTGFFIPKSRLLFVMQGLNELKVVDELEPLYAPVFLRTYGGEIIWNPCVWGMVKKGYVAQVAEAVYHMGIILRLLQMYPEARPYCHKEMEALVGSTSNKSAKKLLDSFWKNVVKSRSPASEGLTMFEFCMKYGQGTLIDVIRQFAFVYPDTHVTSKHGVDSKPFVHAKLGHGASYLTVMEICKNCEDPAVRRWADDAKDLIAGRFSKIRPIYKNHAYQIWEAEDLLNTEDEPEERIFYVKDYTPKIDPRDLQSSTLEELEEAHKESQMYKDYEHRAYLNLEVVLKKTLKKQFRVFEDDMMKGRKLEETILFRQNLHQMIGPFQARLPRLADQRLDKDHARAMNQAFVFKPYVKTLRQALDNEGLSGGLDVPLVRHISECILYGLVFLNNPWNWVERIKDTELKATLTGQFKAREAEGKSWNRIHGNLSPRNIVCLELGEVNTKTDAEITEKWALMDLTHSQYHKEDLNFDLYNNSAYMPPEIARRVFTYEKNVSKKLEVAQKMDSWGFGCILFEMLAGVPLFKVEQREDAILLSKERAELANWIRLDEDRISMIMRERPSCNSVEESENFDKIRNDAINLVSWCLNGDPKKRPDITDIRNHKFMKFRFKQKKDKNPFLTIDLKEGSAAKIVPHNHVHVVNADFKEGEAFLGSLKKKLSDIGCRMTTDRFEGDATKEKIVEDCTNARIVLCILSRDCFNKPFVMKQLFKAHREYLARVDDLSFNINAQVKHLRFVNLQYVKGPEQFSKDAFNKWQYSEGFGYLTQALGKDEEFMEVLKADSNDSNPASAVRDELKNKYHSQFKSLLRNCWVYRSKAYIDDPMLDHLLSLTNLQGLESTFAYEPIKLKKKKNFKVQPSNSSNRREVKSVMRDYTDKKAAFFMPEKKIKRLHPHRVVVLDSHGPAEWTAEAVKEITAGMQAHVYERAKSATKDYRVDLPIKEDHIFNKILNKDRVKKMTASHLPAYPRVPVLTKLRDMFFFETVDAGRLVVVCIVDKDFTDMYAELLDEYEKQRGPELHIIPVYLSMSGDVWKGEHEKLMQKLESTSLKNKFTQKNFIPYFKKNDSAEHRACLERVNKVGETLTNGEVNNEGGVIVVK